MTVRASRFGKLALFLFAVVLSCILQPVALSQTASVPSTGADASTANPSNEELAKLKQNPVGGLRQVIFNAEVSPNLPATGETAGVYSLQVVWPFPVDEDWKLITYSIVPVLHVPNASGEGSTTGLSDTLLNFFVSPTKPGALVWGAGPAVLLPTRSKPELGTDRVGLGPAVVLFYPKNNWSAGVVLQNVWSLGGSGSDRVNEFSAQYIVNYNLPDGWYLYSNATITADWTAKAHDQWTVPLGGGVGKVFTVGKQSVNVALQAFKNVATPTGGPTWSWNLQLALLFP